MTSPLMHHLGRVLVRFVRYFCRAVDPPRQCESICDRVLPGLAFMCI